MSQAFISRVVNYVANEIIVKGLSNSRTFQKFAVRTNKQYEELNKHGTDKISKTFEDIVKNQQQTSEAGTAAAAEAAAVNAAKNNNNNALQPPPQRPMRGIPGFFLAFGKEVRKDITTTAGG
jgi:hypothetical protein